MASSIESTFGPSFLNKTIDEKVSICETWLQANEGDPFCYMVNTLLSQAKSNVSLENENASLKKINESWSLKTVYDKYPKVVDKTRSGFYWPNDKQPANIEQTILGEKLLEMVEAKLMNEKFFKVQFTRPQEDCDCETDCVYAVKALLESAIKSLGVDKIIGVVPKRTLAGAECDLLLIYKPNRLPFAPLEIKKPPNDQKDREKLFHGDDERGGNKVAGEMWEELNGIRLFGFTKVYGMISTQNQYRLVCTDKLNDESDAVEARHIETLLDTLEELKTMADEPEVRYSNPYRGPMSPPGKPFKIKTSLKKEKRNLFASQIIPNLDDTTKEIVPVEEAGPEILQLAILFILKACATLKELLQRGESREVPAGIKIPCRILETKDFHQFAFGTIKLGQVNLEKYNSKLQTIYVIRHIGMGATANCCLGVSGGGGSCCAVKFYHEAGKQQTIELVNQEFDNWQNIYGNDIARKLELTKGYCLVMPYLKPIPESERCNLLRERAGGRMSEIEETLRKFAATGYKHNDIKWRHLGYWEGKIYLFDLGDVTKREDDDIDSWVSEALEYLRKRAVEPPQKTAVTRSPKRARDHGKTASGMVESLPQGHHTKKRRGGSQGHHTKKRRGGSPTHPARPQHGSPNRRNLRQCGSPNRRE